MQDFTMLCIPTAPKGFKKGNSGLFQLRKIQHGYWIFSCMKILQSKDNSLAGLDSTFCRWVRWRRLTGLEAFEGGDLDILVKDLPWMELRWTSVSLHLGLPEWQDVRHLQIPTRRGLHI